jgi:hypothetical protein
MHLLPGRALTVVAQDGQARARALIGAPRRGGRGGEMSAMLIAVLFLAGQLGQNHWC